VFLPSFVSFTVVTGFARMKANFLPLAFFSTAPDPSFRRPSGFLLSSFFDTPHHAWSSRPLLRHFFLLCTQYLRPVLLLLPLFRFVRNSVVADVLEYRARIYQSRSPKNCLFWYSSGASLRFSLFFRLREKGLISVVGDADFLTFSRKVLVSLELSSLFRPEIIVVKQIGRAPQKNPCLCLMSRLCVLRIFRF